MDSKDGGCTELRWMVKIVKERESERIALCEIFMVFSLSSFQRMGLVVIEIVWRKLEGKFVGGGEKETCMGKREKSYDRLLGFCFSFVLLLFFI